MRVSTHPTSFITYVYLWFLNLNVESRRAGNG